MTKLPSGRKMRWICSTMGMNQPMYSSAVTLPYAFFRIKANGGEVKTSETESSAKCLSTSSASP